MLGNHSTPGWVVSCVKSKCDGAGLAPRNHEGRQDTAAAAPAATRMTAAMAANRQRGRSHLVARRRQEPVRRTDSPCPESICRCRSSRSFRRSNAVWYRPSGSLARQRVMARSSSTGTKRLTSDGGGGVSRTMADITATTESPTNGRTPAAISYNTTPSEKMSDRTSTGRPCACSGDM